MLMDPIDRIPVDLEFADDYSGKVNPAGAQLAKRHWLFARASQPLKHPQLLGFNERHLPDCRVLVEPDATDRRDRASTLGRSGRHCRSANCSSGASFPKPAPLGSRPLPLHSVSSSVCPDQCQARLFDSRRGLSGGELGVGRSDLGGERLVVDHGKPLAPRTAGIGAKRHSRAPRRTGTRFCANTEATLRSIGLRFQTSGPSATVVLDAGSGRIRSRAGAGTERDLGDRFVAKAIASLVAPPGRKMSYPGLFPGGMRAKVVQVAGPSCRTAIGKARAGSSPCGRTV